MAALYNSMYSYDYLLSIEHFVAPRNWGVEIQTTSVALSPKTNLSRSFFSPQMTLKARSQLIIIHSAQPTDHKLTHQYFLGKINT